MVWLTSGETAEHARRSRWTVRNAAEQGLLHGHQPVDGQGKPKRNGRWSFNSDAVDAWIQGHDLHAQQQACGCPSLRALPAQGRARRPA